MEELMAAVFSKARGKDKYCIMNVHSLIALFQNM